MSLTSFALHRFLVREGLNGSKPMRRPNIDSTIVREEERGFAAAAHLVNIVPFWGFVFLVGLWVYFKERSREVVLHVQQALAFQTLFLGAGVVWLFLSVIFKIVARLSSGLGIFLERANFFFLLLLFAAYAFTCVVACAMTYAGRPFVYPMIGRRVLEGTPGKSVARG